MTKKEIFNTLEMLVNKFNLCGDNTRRIELLKHMSDLNRMLKEGNYVEY